MCKLSRHKSIFKIQFCWNKEMPEGTKLLKNNRWLQRQPPIEQLEFWRVFKAEDNRTSNCVYSKELQNLNCKMRSPPMKWEANRFNVWRPLEMTGKAWAGKCSCVSWTTWLSILSLLISGPERLNCIFCSSLDHFPFAGKMLDSMRLSKTSFNLHFHLKCY